MKDVCLIVARDVYGTIGNENQLPGWKLKTDMLHFVEKTIGNAIIMGRKNFESIGRPLPNRTNIVLTTNEAYGKEVGGIIVCTDWWKALSEAQQATGERIFIIGGAEIYHLALDTLVIKELFVTEVLGTFKGDVKFRGFNENLYTMSEVKYKKDEKNSHDFSIKHFILK